MSVRFYKTTIHLDGTACVYFWTCDCIPPACAVPQKGETVNIPKHIPSEQEFSYVRKYIEKKYETGKVVGKGS